MNKDIDFTILKNIIDDKIYISTPDYLEKRVLSLIEQKSNEIKEKKTSLIFNKEKSFFSISSLRFVFAILLIIIIPLIFFILFNVEAKLKFSIIASKGNFIFKRGEKNLAKANNYIKENDKIITEKDSFCKIQLEKNTILLTEETEICIERAKDKNIILSLKKGQIILNIEKSMAKKGFSITTNNEIITVVGTTFLVGVTSEGTYLSIENGKVSLTSKKENQKAIMIEKGKTAIIKQQEIKIIENNKEIVEIFNNFINNENEKIKKIEKLINKKATDLPEEFKYQKIYSNKAKIIGFTKKDDYIIAQFETSTVCFDKNGKFKWENNYRENNLFFMSTPLVKENKVYISSVNKKLVILNLITGRLLDIIDAPGNLIFNYQGIINNNFIIYPFKDGLYKFDTLTNAFEEDPFISYNNPKTPLFLNDMIILSSFIENILSAYSIKGERLWDIKLKDRSLAIPIVSNNTIYITDSFGYFYAISKKGIILSEKKLPDGVSAPITPYEEYFYLLADNGILYKVNKDIEKCLIIDNNPDKENYLYKSIFIFNSFFFIGTEQGSLIIYSPEENKTIKEIKISDYPIISILQNKSFFWTASQKSDIIILY